MRTTLRAFVLTAMFCTAASAQDVSVVNHTERRPTGDVHSDGNCDLVERRDSNRNC